MYIWMSVFSIAKELFSQGSVKTPFMIKNCVQEIVLQFTWFHRNKDFQSPNFGASCARQQTPLDTLTIMDRSLTALLRWVLAIGWRIYIILNHKGKLVFRHLLFSPPMILEDNLPVFFGYSRLQEVIGFRTLLFDGWLEVHISSWSLGGVSTMLVTLVTTVIDPNI